MSRSADPVDLCAAPDPVREFWRAHEWGRPVALRTSGTTGQGRLVVRTTTSWTSSFEAVSYLAGMTPESSVWIPGPLTSTMNLFAHVHAEAAGAAVVHSVAGASHAVLTPLALTRALASHGLAQGTTVIVAGDALRPNLIEAARGQSLKVHHYYGASELSFVAWGPDGAPLTAFPGAEIRVLDSVIWVRSPYLALGYLDDAVGGPMRWSADGYASVGDRGSLSGVDLEVHGRGDEGITTAGVTIVVADVERMLRAVTHGEVYVVGLTDERLGAVVVAVVTEPSDLVALKCAARQLDPAQRPRRWFALTDIPVTEAGKPDRQLMRQMLAAGAVAEVGR